jgi:hypothetical protein
MNIQFTEGLYIGFRELKTPDRINVGIISESSQKIRIHEELAMDRELNNPELSKGHFELRTGHEAVGDAALP